MSIPVDLAALADALGRHAFAYLLVSAADRPHVTQVFPALVEGVLVVPEPGRTAGRVVGERPTVSLLFPPREDDGYSLIVDGRGELGAGGELRVTPSTAVLHRAASVGQGQEHATAGACGNDCQPLT